MTPAEEPGALPSGAKRPSPATLAGKRSPGSDSTSPTRKPGKRDKKVEEISAGGLVVNVADQTGLLIGRRDKRGRMLWSLPKGHIEAGETPEDAALREVLEETGITSEILRLLGVIDFWFMADGKRIHKTVHHFLFQMTGGILQAQINEVDEVAWFPIRDFSSRLAYSDERKLIASFGDIRTLLP
jgi:ADP-ribose pyrophosphatase YjhB (NUDIX family)